VDDFVNTYMTYLGGSLAPRLRQGSILQSGKWNQKVFYHYSNAFNLGTAHHQPSQVHKFEVPFQPQALWE